MAGKIIVVWGMTGSGKTTWVKNKFKNSKSQKITKALIAGDYDNNATNYLDFMEFLKKMNSITNAMGAVDEAFTVLPKNLNIEKKSHRFIAESLVNARKLNNIIFFVLHAAGQVPVWLIQYTNIVVRFESNDQWQYQIQRFMSYPTLIESFTKKQKLKKFEPDIIFIQ